MKYPEELLQVLWKCRLYAQVNLLCVGGEFLQILNPGVQNRDAGPDFLQAKLRIDNILWVGHVEIHWDAKSWFSHGHQDDDRYDNVILHVVWENHCDIKRKDGSAIPTLQLKNYVSPDVLKQYHKLYRSKNWVPCASQLSNVPLHTKMQVLDRMLQSRLEAKTAEIIALLAHSANDWEKATQRIFAESFGMRVNRSAFSRLISTLPVNILDRYQGNEEEIAALLFGQSGLLPENIQDDYTARLKSKYHHIRQLHQLNPMQAHEWHFLRMRPASFPTIRIAQLASVFTHVSRICQLIISTTDLRELQMYFSNFKPSAYWSSHYQFGRSSKSRMTRLTPSFLDHIAINCFVPVMYAYGRQHGNELLQIRAVDWLNHIAREHNSITANFAKVGLSAQHAADSQALIQLLRTHCEAKQCLSCGIGIYLLGRP